MKHRFGVEAICRVLSATESGFITDRGYRAAKTRPPSARVLSDDLLGAEISRLHADNYGVYGVRKMHALMRRQAWAIGRDQTGRIMRDRGLAGVRRSKKVFTTRPDPTALPPTDLVERRFIADAPRRLWVADITYVRTWSGFTYVALEWVWWWNNQRLHGELDYRTPAEVEAGHYADLESPRLATASHGKP